MEIKLNTHPNIFILFLFILSIPSMNQGQTHSLPFTLSQDIVWASAEGFKLTMDIYTPQDGKDQYPVLIIFHGGGWLINNKTIMNEMATYMVENGKYVVCNVNYRLLADQQNTVNLNQIVEDALGAVLWVQANIKKYKGDPRKIAVTGDSAGGHLAAMVMLVGNRLSSSGFADEPLCFHPSFLPPNTSPEDIVAQGGIKVQACVVSYGVLDVYRACLMGFEKPMNFFWQRAGVPPRPILGKDVNVHDDPSYYQAVSPLHLIPQARDQSLPPQLYTAGSKDLLVTPESVQSFVEKLRKAGHHAEYWEYEGRPHAYLDSGTNELLGTSFDKDGPPALDKMISFINAALDD